MRHLNSKGSLVLLAFSFVLISYAVFVVAIRRWPFNQNAQGLRERRLIHTVYQGFHVQSLLQRYISESPKDTSVNAFSNRVARAFGLPGEYVSLELDANSRLSTELDGKGGWFVDFSRGIVRINVTNRVQIKPGCEIIPAGIDLSNVGEICPGIVWKDAKEMRRQVKESVEKAWPLPR